MNSQLKGVSVGDLRKAMRPKPQRLPSCGPTIGSPKQKHKLKYVEKIAVCRYAFESQGVSFGRFEFEMWKSYWFLWMFFQFGVAWNAALPEARNLSGTAASWRNPGRPSILLQKCQWDGQERKKRISMSLSRRSFDKSGVWNVSALEVGCWICPGCFI